MPRRAKKVPKLSPSALKDLRQLSPNQVNRATSGGVRRTEHVRRDSVFNVTLGDRKKFVQDSVLLATKFRHDSTLKAMDLEIAKMQSGRRAGEQSSTRTANGSSSTNIVAGDPKRALSAARSGGRAIAGKVASALLAVGSMLPAGRALKAGSAVAKLSRAKQVRALISSGK